MWFCAALFFAIFPFFKFNIQKIIIETFQCRILCSNRYFSPVYRKHTISKLANKQYVFTLSDAVPGGVYAVRTRIDGESPAAAPLLVEEMVLDGATPSARNP